MMTTNMTNMTKLDKTAMSEGGMMTNFKSSVWRVAHGAVIVSLVLMGLTSVEVLR